MLNWKVSAGLAAIVLHLATAGGPTLAGATKADPPSGTYHYAIVYPLFGRIGTFTNRVHADGERVAVESHLRIAVKMLFVTIHHAEADRTELWRGDRLVRFNGTTDDNGQVARVERHADGGKFLIDGPSGEITAPADVFPADPWTIRFTHAKTMMNIERGTIGRVVIRENPPQGIRIGDRVVEARHFTVRGGGGGQVWYGLNDAPVRFSFESHGHSVTFTMER